jgi:hypothetical protein
VTLTIFVTLLATMLAVTIALALWRRRADESRSAAFVRFWFWPLRRPWARVVAMGFFAVVVCLGVIVACL